MLRYLLVRSDRHVSQGDKIAMSAGRQQSYHAFHTFRAFRAASSISAETIDDDLVIHGTAYMPRIEGLYPARPSPYLLLSTLAARPVIF